ncbi:polysaccharide biosynthesis protein [Lachnotalea glycerini]|nr:hypothetical protein [Lachnotalea glycerini]
MGGQDYRKLNYKKISTQYWISMFEQIVFAAISAFVLFNCIENFERKFVFLAVCIFWIINNATGFLSSVLQAVNRTYQFSLSVMLEKIFFIVFILVVIILNNINYNSIIIGYILSRIIALIYSIYCCKEIVSCGIYYSREILIDRVENIKVGAILLLSGVVSVLILGIGRQIIDWHWGVETFAIISFSLSITNFFLQFINQISMVMFPMLRITNDNVKAEIYQIARIILSHLLTGILLLYFPIVNILQIWLPEYQKSFKYLILTLIICIFDGKMQMLFSTYMKVFRKEKVLLAINVVSLIFSAILSFVSAYIFRDFTMVVFGMALSIAIRSIISEIYLGNMLNQKFYKLLFTEIFLSAFFVLSFWLYGGTKSFVFYFVLYLLSLYIDKKNIKLILKYIKKRR